MFPTFKLKLAVNTEDRQLFFSGYKGLNISDTYLEGANAYMLLKNNILISGFIINYTESLRYIEAISCKDIKNTINNKLEKLKVAEVTGLWLNKQYRGSLTSILLWLSIARKTIRGKADFYLFATTSNSLRKAMVYPKCVSEILSTKLNPVYGEKTGYFFLAKRSRAITGMLQGIYHLKLRPNIKHIFIKSLNRLF